MSSCCSPSGRPENGSLELEVKPALLEKGMVGAGHAQHEEAFIPGGTFAMGDPFDEGYPADGETPVHHVQLSSFSMDVTAVTNQQFAAFIDNTGYRTESEVYGTSAVFHLAVQASQPDILGTAAGTPWWLNVRGADWAHPSGPLSSWEENADHPVTQISHTDALAYCAWAGRSLPTEAQWEFAARGGLEQARYPWGDELHGVGEDGQLEHRCNIWQGTFPTVNTVDDGFLATAPVKSFDPNGYGLYQTSGNVWEWCADWFLPKYYKSCLANGLMTDPVGPTIGRGRVMRGGSYLCHDSYCNRYRLAARSSNSPESASGNCGFRTVAAA